MVRIPYIKIPSVRVGSIGPTSNIGTGGATPAPPTPIIYLTQWKIVGNSEVHGNEIWSCGEYNPIDGKWHILVQPQGGSITDIALTEPLRKVNDVADTIEFPSGTDGKALVTRNIAPLDLHYGAWNYHSQQERYYKAIDNMYYLTTERTDVQAILCATYTNVPFEDIASTDKAISGLWNGNYRYISVKDTDVTNPSTDITGVVLLQLVTPTTELVDAPQIAEADSYSCVISQGGKAVSWSSFETE